MSYHCEIIEHRLTAFPPWTRSDAATTSVSSLSPTIIVVAKQPLPAQRSETVDELNEREWGWSKRWERMRRVIRRYSQDEHGDY